MKMAMQEYNFRLFHIPGERNVVADGFSRLTEETPAASFNVLDIIEEPFISVGTELIRASEETVSLDVTASPPLRPLIGGFCAHCQTRLMI